jgi:hypothetical protein
MGWNAVPIAPKRLAGMRIEPAGVSQGITCCVFQPAGVRGEWRNAPVLPRPLLSEIEPIIQAGEVMLAS